MNSYCLIRYMRVYASPWLQQNWHDKEVWSHLGDWRSVRLSVLKCFGKHSFCYFLFYFVGIVYHITLSLIVSTTVLIVVSFILWFSSTLYCHSSFDCGVTLRNIIHIHYIITSDVNIDTNIHITSLHITSHPITSHPILWHYITSHHITSHHITSHHIVSGAVDPSIGAKRVIHEIGLLSLESAGTFINCEDGLQIPWWTYTYVRTHAHHKYTYTYTHMNR
jgi:hypothetical protein